MRQHAAERGGDIVGVGALAVFGSSPGQTYVASVFVDPIARDTGWSRTLISGVYTLGSLTAAPAMFLVGQLLDRVGARAALGLVVVLFGAAALAMTWVAHPFHLYVGFAFLRLLGQGSMTVVPTAMVALWFIRLRGRALSLTSLGAVAGQAVFPPLVLMLITRTDWRTAWVALAFVIWLLLLPPVLLLVRRDPESIGLRPDGDPAPAVTTPGADPTARHADEDWTFREARRTRAFWLLMAAGAAPSLITTALTFHHVSFMASRGLTPAVASAVFSIVAVAALAGTFAGGVLSDRLPARFIIAGGQTLLIAAMAWAFTIGAPWAALVYGALLGLSSGVGHALQAVVWPAYFGRRNLGTIRSVAASSTIASAAIGPLPFGWLFDRTGSYDVAIGLFIALPVGAAMAAMSAVKPRRGGRLGRGTRASGISRGG